MHSNVSDGVLAPAAVAQLAAQQQVTAFALTDHDDTSGLEAAQRCAREHAVCFIPGVEISVTWQTHTIHIVGLGIDPSERQLTQGLASIRSSRDARAERIARKLTDLGITGTLDGARGYAANPSMIGRTHFARHLIKQGHARDMNAVFDRYLGQGKPGYVAHQWAALNDAVGWIRAAGGSAVLAHPGRYRMERSAMRELLREFKQVGGEAVEVITSNHSYNDSQLYANYAREFALRASRGSDFHAEDESRSLPGDLPALPSALTPVWREQPWLKL